MLGAGVIAASSGNRWLLAFIVVTMVVIAAGAAVRRRALDNSLRLGGTSRRQDLRTQAGALVVLGPLIGLAFAPSAGDLTLVIVVGAVGLAVAGVLVERTTRPGPAVLGIVAIAGVLAVVVGARLEPTGVPALDAIAALAFVIAVTKSIDGTASADGAVPTLAALAAAGLFAIAAFAHQDGLAAVLVGLAAACVALLAYNRRPATLLLGRGGSLPIGFALAVGALAVTTSGAAWRGLVTPLIALSLLLVDATVVVVSRLRRRQPLLEHRDDHVVHRLAALGWRPIVGLVFLAAAQLVLSTIAVFVARSVMPAWVAAPLVLLVLGVVAIEVGRARVEREQVVGLPRVAYFGLGALALFGLFAVVPLAIAAASTVDLMQEGRKAASHGLDLARDGNTLEARAEFTRATDAFSDASDTLGSPLLAGGLAVPFLAENVDAARSLAKIGTDLARAGRSLTEAVDPDAIKVVDGRLPVEEVVRITPQLEAAAGVLGDARQRLADLRDDAYLVEPVRDALAKVYVQLARADREARHAADAAKLAPAIFGADGDRTYLLIVQNNAEARATGGLIGSFALLTAHDGDIDVGEIQRTHIWNDAVRTNADVTYEAPQDYRSRYQQYFPGTTLQNVNLSPDFPSVAEVLTSLAPQAGLPPIDGILSVDPKGLAALLELTGPVDVEGWPDPIDSGNVVDVTLRDAYATFSETPERADFLGDVARAAVREATTGSLGKPAEIARVLGRAAHEGHLILAFRRPGEQQLARTLGVSGELPPVRSDAIALTTSNEGANKIDYYLERTVEYRARLVPNAGATAATVQATLSATLDNTAPASGLPEGVIGPFIPGYFVAGQNRSLVSLYSPLTFRSATVDGAPTAATTVVERGRNVLSLLQNIDSKTTKTTAAELDGTVALHDGWYALEVRAQPTLNPDQVHVSVEVPTGWTIDQAPGMTRSGAREATATTALDKTTTYRVHLVRDTSGFTLWERLQAGV